ncbi:MAG: hypothetical protein ACK559_38645, partial [bacterium]
MSIELLDGLQDSPLDPWLVELGHFAPIACGDIEDVQNLVDMRGDLRKDHRQLEVEQHLGDDIQQT